MNKLSKIYIPNTDHLPNYIAIPFRQTLEESNRVRRLQLLLHTFKRIIHFLSICFVCDYLNSDNIVDHEIEQLLSGLKKPLLGYWIKILQNLPSLLTKHKILFINNWLESFSKFERNQYENCIDFDLSTSRSNLPGIEAFLKLRNSLSHGGLPPNETLSESLYNHYYPIIVDIIEAIQLLKGFKLSCQYENETGNLNHDLLEKVYLLRLSDNLKLNLDPLIINISSVEKSQKQNIEEEFLIYEGINKQTIYYLGIEGKYEVNQNIEKVSKILFSQKNFTSGYWKESFFNQVKEVTLESISSTHSIEYIANVYQNREKYTSIINNFIFDKNSKYSCLLLIAESGIGKTSLLCNLVSNLLAKDYINPLPMLILSEDLIKIDPSRVLYSSGELGQLGLFIRNLLNLQEINLDWHSLLQVLEQKIEPGVKDSGPRMILCLDGINEAANPYHLLQEFDYVVRLARNTSWLSCIGTIRKGSLELFLAKLHEWSIKWPQSERSYVRDGSLISHLNVGIYLEPFSEQEAYQAYQRYQVQSASGLNVPASLSSYLDLPEAIRQMIRQPLTLDFLMKTYNQKLIPANLAPTKLFEEFHNNFLSSFQSTLLINIARRCFELKQSDFSSSDILDILDACQHKNNEFESIEFLNPLKHLVDLRILIYDNKSRYKFTHQLYFEFILFKYLQDLNLSLENLTEKIISILKFTNQHLDEEIGAIKLLFISMTIQLEQPLILILLSLTKFELFCQFFTPILYELQRINESTYINIKNSVLKQNNKTLLLKFYEIYKTICDRDAQCKVLNILLNIETDNEKRASIELKYVRLLIAMDRISQAFISLKNLKKYADTSHHNELLLSIYVEEGYLNFLKGNSIESLEAYNKASLLLNKIKTNLDEDDYLQRQRNIFAGMGCSQHNLDNNKTCLENHFNSLLIDKKLDNKSDVALDLVNIADAHWGCYQYGDSLKSYQEAINISIKTCYQDALNVALIGHGIVLWSIGLFEESEASINAGLEISSQKSNSWDLAYGLIYKSNVQASIKNSHAIRTNKEALILAQKFGAEYLIALANVYLFWKYETRQPGLFINSKRIQDALTKCQDLKMRGIEIMFLTLKALNNAANPEILNSVVMEDLATLLDTFATLRRIKGPWERMGLQLIQTIQARRQNLDLIDLEDTVDEVCEQKTNSLSIEYRRAYTSNLEQGSFL